MSEESNMPGLMLPRSLPVGFLGTLRQVCVVTDDYRRTIDRMGGAGLGPWSIYSFNSRTCTDLTYRGRPADFSFKVCLADVSGLVWEVIQPISGGNIYSDFLASKGEGVQHLLFDCNDLSWAEKTAALEAAGYMCIQSGRWLDRLAFAYYATEDAIGTVLEIVDRPPDWRRPEPEERIG